MFTNINIIKDLSPASTTPPTISILLNEGESMEKCYESGKTVIGFTADRIILGHVVKTENWIRSFTYHNISSLTVVLDKSGKHSGLNFTATDGSKLEIRFDSGSDRENLYQSIFERINYR